jgi:uncharacterized RDD family membrane protein YckC
VNKEEATRKNLEGLKLLREGDYDVAIRLFSDAIKMDPEYPAPWLNRSEANRKTGREAEAEADMEKWGTLMSKDQEPIVTYGKDREPIVIHGIDETLASTEEYASFWARTGAYITDSILVGIFMVFAFYALLVSTLEPAEQAEASIFVLLVIILTPFWVSIYSWLFIGLKGQTLGKMLFRIKVINTHGGKPGLSRAFLREVIGKLILVFGILLFIELPILFIGLPIFWITQDEWGKGLYDKITGTYVVKVPSRSLAVGEGNI